MKAIFLILFNPAKGVSLFSNEFIDDLHRKSILIFSFYGLFKFLAAHRDYDGNVYLGVLALLISVVISISFWVLLSYLLHWVVKRLNGYAHYEETESIIAHALIPLMMGLAAVAVLKTNSDLSDQAWNSIVFRNSILWAVNLWWLIIIYLGIKGVNRFSFFKTFLILCPVIVLEIAAYLLLMK